MLTSIIALLSLVNIAVGQSSCREGQMWKENPGVCEICPTGYYQNENGAKPTSCQSCPAGFYGTAPHASQCTECSAGQYQDDSNAPSCKSCNSGQFSERGQTGCAAGCGAGMESKKRVATGVIIASINVVDGMNAWFTFTAAPAGVTMIANNFSVTVRGATQQSLNQKFTVVEVSSAISFKATASGLTANTYDSSGMVGHIDSYIESPCRVCAFGQFSSDFSTASCKHCATATTPLYSLNNRTSCTTACPPGHMIMIALGNTSCVQCPSGYYHNGEGSNTLPCKSCVEGQFADGVAIAASCKTCPSGKTTGVHLSFKRCRTKPQPFKL